MRRFIYHRHPNRPPRERPRQCLWALPLGLALALLLTGCGAPLAAPPPPTATPTAAPPTATTRPTATTQPTSPPADTPAPTDSATPAPTATATASATATPVPTDTPLPTDTATATPHPRWTATPVPPPTAVVFSQGTARGNPIALTFDCGADRGEAATILDYLRRQGIPATFGVTGRWAEQNSDLIRRMVAQGAQIVNHTYDHQSFTGLSTHAFPLDPKGITDELERADAILRHLTGSSTRPYYRPPYGDESPDTLKAVAAAGYNVDVRWTLDSLGWDGLSATQIQARVLGAAAPGAIVLMHVGQASQDAVALPRVVDGLRAHGYHFVTIKGLLAADHGSAAPRLTAPASYRAVDPAAVYYPGTAPGPLANHVVVLDPGHGGDDPGTCYPYVYNCADSSDPSIGAILNEKTGALDIALYHLLPRLHLLGADVYLTRTTASQNPDLEQRLQLANYVARLSRDRRRALFISVHLNGASDPSVDYSQALYAARRPSALASTLDAATARTLQPAPKGGDHGIDTFPGHVLRRNRLPATIVEPAFLTNVYPVQVPISVTRIVTATSGAALRRGLRLADPVVAVAVRRAHGRHAAGLTLQEAFRGTVPLRDAITLARTTAISAAMAPTMTALISTSAPLSASVPPASAGPISITAPPTLGAVLPITAPSIAPGVTYAISVSGAISATDVMTTFEGEGPWLLAAHQRTARVNGDYGASAPVTLPLRYAWKNREEVIARGLVQGVARFFDARLPADALRPRAAPVALDPVIPPSG